MPEREEGVFPLRASMQQQEGDELSVDKPGRFHVRDFSTC
jgi:hypothetical protein